MILAQVNAANAAAATQTRIQNNFSYFCSFSPVSGTPAHPSSRNTSANQHRHAVSSLRLKIRTVGVIRIQIILDQQGKHISPGKPSQFTPFSLRFPVRAVCVPSAFQKKSLSGNSSASEWDRQEDSRGTDNNHRGKINLIVAKRAESCTALLPASHVPETRLIEDHMHSMEPFWKVLMCDGLYWYLAYSSALALDAWRPRKSP